MVDSQLRTKKLPSLKGLNVVSASIRVMEPWYHLYSIVIKSSKNYSSVFGFEISTRFTHPCLSNGIDTSIRSTALLKAAAVAFRFKLSSLLFVTPRKSRLPNLLFVWRGSFRFKVRFWRNIAESVNHKTKNTKEFHSVSFIAFTLDFLFGFCSPACSQYCAGSHKQRYKYSI